MRRFLNNRISNYNNVGDKVDDFCEDCENRWLPFSRVWWDSTEKNIANIKRKDNGIFVIKKILSLINSISESIKDIYDRINVIEPPILSEKLIELENDYLEVGVTADDKQEDLNIAIYENYINLKNTKVNKPIVESTSDSLKIVALDNQGESVFIKSSEVGKVKSVNNKIGDVILKTSDLENDSDYITNLKLNQERDERISGDNLKLDKPTTDGTVISHPNIVGVDDLGNSAKLKASDFGKVKSVNGKEGDVILKTSDLENDSDYTTNATLTAHTSNKTNPHNVTKEQIGLGNVDNTSDLNKPISTATQIELNKKINKPTTNNTPDYVLLADGSTAPKSDFGKVNKVMNVAPDANKNIDISGVAMNWTNSSQRFSRLLDKSADATYNKVAVLDSANNLATANYFTSEFVRLQNGSRVGFAMKHRFENPNFYGLIGNQAIDLSLSYSTSSEFGANGYQAIAIGNNIKARGDQSVGIGVLAETNSDSVSIGNIVISGYYSVAIGSHSNASGSQATAVGSQAKATGFFSVSIGSSIAIGQRATAVGSSNKASVDYSNALGGSFLNADVYKSVVLGFSNPRKTNQSTTTWIPTDDLFVVGNGNNVINELSEALNLKKNGHLTLPSVTNSMIDTSDKSVITKEYLDIRIPKPPTTGEYALKSINGVVSWVLN